MSRLFILVEGQTEETFVNELLRPHLVDNYRYHAVSARLMGNARARSRRGGVRKWPEIRKEILTQLRQDVGCFLTILVDFYGMPASSSENQNPNAWPGRTT